MINMLNLPKVHYGQDAVNWFESYSARPHVATVDTFLVYPKFDNGEIIGYFAFDSSREIFVKGVSLDKVESMISRIAAVV